MENNELQEYDGPVTSIFSINCAYFSLHKGKQIILSFIFFDANIGVQIFGFRIFTEKKINVVNTFFLFCLLFVKENFILKINNLISNKVNLSEFLYFLFPKSRAAKVT